MELFSVHSTPRSDPPWNPLRALRSTLPGNWKSTRGEEEARRNCGSKTRQQQTDPEGLEAARNLHFTLAPMKQFA
jgi:hypothetical protein